MNEINQIIDPEADDVDIMSIDDTLTSANQKFYSLKRKMVDDQQSTERDPKSLKNDHKSTENAQESRENAPESPEQKSDSPENDTESRETDSESQISTTDQVFNSDFLSKLNAELQLKNPEAYQAGYRIIDMEERGMPYFTGQRYQMWQLDANGKIILELRPLSELIFEFKSVNSHKRKLADEPDSQENNSDSETDSDSQENESLNTCKTFSCFNCLDDITPSELSQIRAENKFDLVCRKCRVFCWSCQSKLSQKELEIEINSLGGFRSCNKCYTKRSSVFI